MRELRNVPVVAVSSDSSEDEVPTSTPQTQNASNVAHEPHPQRPLVTVQPSATYSFSPVILSYLQTIGIPSGVIPALQSTLDHDEQDWVTLFIHAGMDDEHARALRGMVLSEYPRDLVDMMRSLHFDNSSNFEDIEEHTLVAESDGSSTTEVTESSISYSTM